MSRTGDHAAFFEGLRPYLLRVAYTETGSVADSEDVVQEAWLRYDRVDRSGIENPKAWLTTVVTRLALDSLGSARSRRESYVGEWLPEPLVTTAPSSDPAERVTLDESVSMALMVLLESVSPAERCAFVLHDIFGFRFEEVSRVVGRTPEAVRQLASRARRHVEAGRSRFPPTPQEHYRVVEAFRQATHAGDVEALIKLLDPRVRVRADGGGVVPSIRRAIVGAPRAAQVLNALARRFPDREEVPAEINGALGLVVRVGDQLSVMLFTIDSGLITEVDIFRNPHKLAHVDIP